jgi:nifR3 family TIM-barrel protein
MGAALVCAEMVSDKGMIYNSKKTEDMLYFEEMERPISQQIFGSDKETFTEAAKRVYEIMKPDIIDINMGCPVPKVAVKSQAGSALLKNPELIREIVSSVVSAVPVPVTVKIRSGWDFNSINAVEVAKICESAGAKAITVHPRTRSQQYTGKADLDIIKQVKEAVNIPVIGNGDIKSCYDAKRMLDETKCDAIMIGRGVLGNPDLIARIEHWFNTGEVLPDPSLAEKIEILKRHIEKEIFYRGEYAAMKFMRKFYAHYIKGVKNAASIRDILVREENINEVVKILDGIAQNG